MVTRVKICGLRRSVDVETAIEAGADALGFVYERSSPRNILDIPQRDIEGWVASAGPYVTSFAVFGPLPPGFTPPLGFRGVQATEGEFPTSVVRVRCLRFVSLPGDEELALLDGDACDAVLIEAHSERGYGGTGERLDLGLAAEVVQRLSKPTILAGGLTPDNVAEAVRRVRPYGVDVSSGVELSPGIKDPGKVRAFIAAAKGALSATRS